MTKVFNGMSVPQLSENTNYDNWSLQMKVLLGSQDVWDIVEDGYIEPADDEHQTVKQIAALKKTRVKDRSTLYFLYNAVDESGFEKIANAKSAKEAWEILKVAYKGDTRVMQVRVQALRREFEHMEMDENEGIADFIARVQKMVNQLRMNGEEVPPNRVAEKILRNLTDDFESIVVTIEQTKDLSTLTVEELAGAEVLAVDGEEDEDEVDVAEVGLMKIKPITRIGMTEDKEKTEEISQEWSVLSVASTTTMQTSVRQQSATTVASLVILQMDMESPISIVDELISVKGVANVEKELKQKDEEIQRIGRLLDEANEIRNKQRVELEELKKAALEKEDKASSVFELDKNREEDEEEMKDDEISTNSVWYLDSGASNHMCGNENFFYEFTKVEAKFVSFGDDSKVAVKGHGTIQHIQNNGRVEEIRDVLYLKDKHGRLTTQVKAKKNRLYEVELKILERRCKPGVG
ncbi:uncharacterized protein LOC124845232 [Vigna umbellata]|uniref:uncharacterized protein LOC124845232 n=1 Tax=Vigna umbellata TaxID=87088 RepID=UPI001F5FB2C5|nr:uncharacterized protein LOC124845232 [Vigna umbellata]